MKVYLAKNSYTSWDGALRWAPAVLEEKDGWITVWPVEIEETTLPLIECPKEFWAKLVELGYAKL